VEIWRTGILSVVYNNGWSFNSNEFISDMDAGFRKTSEASVFFF